MRAEGKERKLNARGSRPEAERAKCTSSACNVDRKSDRLQNIELSKIDRSLQKCYAQLANMLRQARRLESGT